MATTTCPFEPPPAMNQFENLTVEERMAIFTVMSAWMSAEKLHDELVNGTISELTLPRPPPPDPELESWWTDFSQLPAKDQKKARKDELGTWQKAREYQKEMERYQEEIESLGGRLHAAAEFLDEYGHQDMARRIGEFVEANIPPHLKSDESHAAQFRSDIAKYRSVIEGPNGAVAERLADVVLKAEAGWRAVVLYGGRQGGRSEAQSRRQR